MLALRVLKDRFSEILDAMEPGGSSDPYTGLNAEEREVLTEVTRMGFPLASWHNYKTIGMGAFPILFDAVVQKDSKYFAEDFWKVSGYAGANPPASLLRARVQHRTKIKAVIASARNSRRYCERTHEQRRHAWQQLQTPPSGFQVDRAPEGEIQLATVTVQSGARRVRRFLSAGSAGTRCMSAEAWRR